MICPFCGKDDDKVIDSRASEGGRVIRRRRQCLGCKKRYTTYERVEETARLVVIKRDGSRVPFSRENILRGIRAACGKRPIAEEAKIRLSEEIEDDLHRRYDREVDSRMIGELVASRLRDLDEIAYVRFASEYYQFRNVGDIMSQLEELLLNDARQLEGRLGDLQGLVTQQGAYLETMPSALPTAAERLIDERRLQQLCLNLSDLQENLRLERRQLRKKAESLNLNLN